MSDLRKLLAEAMDIIIALDPGMVFETDDILKRIDAALAEPDIAAPAATPANSAAEPFEVWHARECPGKLFGMGGRPECFDVNDIPWESAFSPGLPSRFDHKNCREVYESEHPPLPPSPERQPVAEEPHAAGVPEGWHLAVPLADGTPTPFHCAGKAHRAVPVEGGRMVTCSCGARWTVPDGNIMPLVESLVELGRKAGGNPTKEPSAAEELAEAARLLVDGMSMTWPVGLLREHWYPAPEDADRFRRALEKWRKK